MRILDLETLKSKTILKVDSKSNFSIKPNLLSKVSLKKEYRFEFTKSNLKNKIIYKCIAKKDVNLDLKITLSTKDINIQNVDVFLEIYILNLHEDNNIVVQPFLEIPNKNIKFEHKVTVGAPSQKWVHYLNSRGLSNNQALKLISESFITG